MTAQPSSSHQLHSSVVLLALALFLSLTGCAYIGGAIALAVSGGSSSSKTVGNQAPSVTFMTTPVPQATDLVALVDYNLIDQESGLIDLGVDYSTDGGLTYLPAAEGPGSDGVSELDSSPTGTPHIYAWNFFADLFAKDLDQLQNFSFDVTLRFVSDDGVTRTPMPTDTVSFRVGNRPPTVVLDSVTATPVDPSVEVRFTLLDDFGDPLDLSIEYSLDGFTSPGFLATPLTPPSAGCSDAITGLASSQGGMQHCFEWDYLLDGFSSADGVELRLIVTDPALASSAPVTSAPFRMGNDPPEAILSPVDTQFGVSIDFLLVDSTSDTADITVDYSVDDGVTYQAATSVVGSVAGLATSAQGEPHNVAWNALVDLGLGTFGMVKVRITPCDDPTGTMVLCGSQVETETFQLQNTDRPLTFVTSPQANGLIQNQVPIDYLIVDFDADPMVSILVEYRAAGSPTFVPATEGVGGNGTTNLTSSQAGTAHIYMWDTAADIPGQDVSDAELKITPSDTMVGTAALGGPYRVNNNTEPTIQNFPTPPTTVTQDVTFTYDIADPEGDSVDLIVEYSTDGGVSWPNHAHEPPGAISDGIQNLTSSPGGTGHIFVWDTSRDLGAVTQTLVRVRITPSDNVDEDLGLGTLSSTTTFVVDNDPSSAPPTIDTISPPQGPSGGLNPVIVTGTGFLQGTTVTIGTQALQGLSLVSTNTITGNIPPYVAGPTIVDVTVDNGNGTATLTAGYTYIVGPTILSVTPNTGALAGMDLVSIATMNFSDDFMASPPVSVTFAGVPATNLMGTGPSTFNVTTPAGVMSGFVNVFVQAQSGDQATLINGFEYLPPPPCMISMITPNLGTVGGGTTVTIDGMSFVPVGPMPTVLFGGVPATNVTGNDTQIMCDTPPGVSLGTVDVDIMNSAGGACMQVAGFTYDVVGMLDNSFGTLGFFLHGGAAGGNGSDRALSVVMDPSGRFVTAGVSSNGANGDMAVWRINPDGTLDTTFNGQGFFVHDGAAGGANDEANDVALDGSGRILVTGYGHNGSNFDMVTWRLNTDGTLDTTFNSPDGFVFHHGAAGGTTHDFGTAILEDPSGRIVIGGHSESPGGSQLFDATVWRYNPDGTFDTTFNGQGWVTHNLPASQNDLVEGIAIDGSGKILLVGEGRDTTFRDLVIWRFNTDGTLDTTFNGQGWVSHDGGGGRLPGNEGGKAFSFDSTGRIIATGIGRDALNDDVMVTWRFNPDGTLDTTFNGQGFVNHDASCPTIVVSEGRGVVVDALDGIVVTGFTNCNDEIDLVIWRFDSAGAFDTTFNGQGWTRAGVVGDDDGADVVLDGAGKIIVAGFSDKGTGDDDMAVWRYNTDGTLDMSLNPGPGFVTYIGASGGNVYDVAWDVVITPAGSILAAGQALDGAFVSFMTVWALNPNGTLDLTFGDGGKATYNNAGLGADDVAEAIALDSMGGILLTGASGADMAIWRLLPDGSLDTTFNGQGWVTHDNAGGGSSVDRGMDITVDATDRSLVCGYSRTPSNEEMAIWRYNPDGTLDTTFNGVGWVSEVDPGGQSGQNERALGIAVDAMDRIVVVGNGYTPSLSRDVAVLRYDSTGVLDPSFGTGGIALHDGAAGAPDGSDTASAVEIDAMGRIVVAGQARIPTGSDVLAVWRFNSDGTLDVTFNGQGWVTHDSAAGGAGNDDAWGLTLDGMGRIVVTGESPGIGTDRDMVTWRFDSTGVLDTTFNGQGWVVHNNAAGGNSIDSGFGVATDSLGRIVVTGQSLDGVGNAFMTVWRYQ